MTETEEFENSSFKSSNNHLIELSTVYFYHKILPRVIKLKECDVTQNTSGIPDTLAALTGYQRKQEGFVAAREYAERNGLDFTVIDFTVKLDQSFTPQLLKPSDLQTRDYLAMTRISKDTAHQLSDILKGSEDETVQRILKLYPAAKVTNLIKRYPALLDTILSDDQFKHFKIINMQVRTPLDPEKTLNLAFVPKRNWSCIQSATCRLDSSIEISLDPPQSLLALKDKTQTSKDGLPQQQIIQPAKSLDTQESLNPQMPENPKHHHR